MKSACKFQRYFELCSNHMSARYSLNVVNKEFEPPFHGDLDGLNIFVDYRLAPQEKLFSAVHLFGHTVQWNTEFCKFVLGSKLYFEPSDSLITRLVDYEREACEYAMTLLFEVGLGHLHQWLSDYSNADLLYLKHFYRTGKQKCFESFFEKNMPLLNTICIPEFVPKTIKNRNQGLIL